MQPIKERIMDHLNTLSCEIGCRPVGTEANHAASVYIENVFRKSGLDIEIQEFNVPVWQLDEAFIEFNGERLEAKANSFSQACEVSGDIIPFCTLEELAASPDLEGKIVFLYGELSKENYIPKGFTIYNPDYHQKTIQLLEDKNPSVIVFVRMETEKNLPIINDWDFSVPSLTVTPEIGLKILNNYLSSSATCTIKSHREKGSTKNIIGRMKGTQEEKIILAAHYDTVFGTDGAFDNASGVAVLLTLAEELSNRNDWKSGFEFIAFSSEEYLGLGDEYYLKEHQRNLEKAMFAMNFDGVGQTLGTNTITLMSGSNKLERCLKEIKKGFPSLQWTSPWYESTHYTFFSNGVPSIPFSSKGVSDLLHTKDDTIQWLSIEKLYESYSIAFEIITSLQGKTSKWTRES